MCNAMDFDGFAKLTEIAKENDLWRPSFGMCYPTIAPLAGCDDDRLDRYVRMIDIHESVQRCYANTVISGLSNVDKEFTLRKDDGSTATISARKLLAHIKVWDPIPEKYVPVFLCLLRRDDRRFHAYFPGGNDTIQAYVDEFRKCPGPQLYFYLLKRRFLHGEASRFIRAVFNLEQQALCSRAKYSKHTGMAFVQNTGGQMDIIDAATALDSGFAVETVKRSSALQPLKYSGPKNNAMEYYDFAEGQSITTIRTTSNKPAGKTDSDASIGIGKSVYEPQGSVAASTAPADMDIDGDDDIGDDEFGSAFVFDLAALKETEQKALKDTMMVSPLANTQPTQVTNHNTTSMTDDDAKAIQEQLTLTLISRSKTADALQIDEEVKDITVPDVPNFAVALEDATHKDYSIMLEIIDGITAALKSITQEDPDLNILEQISHPLFTSALREALISDLTGSEESLTDYLEFMRIAIEDSSKITQGYLAPSNDDDMQLDNDTTPLLLPASASDDAAEKLQGCTDTQPTQTTTGNTVGEDGSMSSSTSRLGADQE